VSAWIVSKTHIDALVQALIEADLIEADKATATGKMLWRENHKSINARYGASPRTPAYTYTPLEGRAFDAPAVIQSAAVCYDYQTCEHEGYRSSKARLFVLALAGMVKDSERHDGLKGPWGVDKRNAFMVGPGVPEAS
jgi:hypothetical protein